MARKNDLDALDALMGEEISMMQKHRDQTTVPSKLVDSLVPQTSAIESHDLYVIPMSEIVWFQGKGDGDFSAYDEDELNSMAENMDERGAYQPALVRQLSSGKYEVLAGEQRIRAEQKKGLTTTRAIVFRGCSDQKAMDIFVLTNLQRRALKISDQIYGWKKWYDNHPNIRTKSVDQEITNISKSIGSQITIGRTAFYRFVSMSNLIKPIIAALDKGELSVLAGYELSHLSHEEQELVLPYLKEVTQLKASLLKESSKQEPLTKELIKAVLTNDSRIRKREGYDTSLRTSMTHIKKQIKSKIKPEFFAQADDIFKEAIDDYLAKHPQYKI